MVARRWISTLLLSVAIVLPERAFASEARSGKSLDAMSPAELERFVQGLNEAGNWRKYRRPGDPPDFVPGKPVRVMVGAGAAFGRGGGGRTSGSFRRSGLSRRSSGLSSRRRGRDDAMTADSSRSRGSLGSSSRSRSSGSSFGGSSRSGFNNSQRVEQGDTGFGFE